MNKKIFQNVFLYIQDQNPVQLTQLSLQKKNISLLEKSFFSIDLTNFGSFSVLKKLTQLRVNVIYEKTTEPIIFKLRRGKYYVTRTCRIEISAQQRIQIARTKNLKIVSYFFFFPIFQEKMLKIFFLIFQNNVVVARKNFLEELRRKKFFKNVFCIYNITIHFSCCSYRSKKKIYSS